MICIDCGSDKIEANQRCASCNHALRKAEREALKPKKAFKPIKKQSDKMKFNVLEYSKLRKQYLKDNPLCNAKLLGCTVKATQVHHLASRGQNFLKLETWLPICSFCHDHIHTKLSAEERRSKGLLI